MNALSRLARLPVRALDAIFRRHYGIWEFTQDPECVLRVSISRSPSAVTLKDGMQLRAGAPVCEIHLWNERLFNVPANASDLRFALRLLRRTEHSLRLLAAYMAAEPRLRAAVAIGGETGVFSFEQLGHPEELIARFGFAYTPTQAKPGLLHRLDFFLQRGYSWVMVWTYNPSAWRRKRFADVGRGEFWLSRQEFMQRYGGA